MATKSLHLSGDPEADSLLSTDPLALLIGMVLDQQIPLERAFAAPAELARRLGAPYDAESLAAMDPGDLASAFSERPALHRFPGSMAARVQALCTAIVEEYGGEAATIWTGARDGQDLLARVKALPGFGEQKARIFVALLGKQLGVRPKGWERVSSPFGDPGSFRSIADIVDQQSLATVRAYKQQMKAAAKAAAPDPDAKAAPSKAAPSRAAPSKAAPSKVSGAPKSGSTKTSPAKAGSTKAGSAKAGGGPKVTGKAAPAAVKPPRTGPSQTRAQRPATRARASASRG
jgi:uncharacterized HhH-GPD family protein